MIVDGAMALPENPTTAETAEAELVLRAKRGDDEAAELLFRTHRRGAFLLAFQILGNRQDALDATQDSFVRFLTTLDRFRPGRPVEPWLYTIVRNRCRDLLRRRQVRKWEPLEGDDHRWRPELVDPGADPRRDAMRGELRRRVWAGLARLSPDHREIVVLRDFQDLTYDEIARVLDIPQGTVMSRLHRARKRLASLLAEPEPANDSEESSP